MWYNTIVGYHGVEKYKRFIMSNAVVILSAIVFLILTAALNLFVLEVNYSGVPKEYLGRIEKIVKSQGISPFTPFSEVDFDKIEAMAIGLDGVDSATVVRRGYSVFISVTTRNSGAGADENVTSIVSDVSGVVKSMTVYRGRALKNVGDRVAEGEILADGEVTLADGRTYLGSCQALICVEKSVTEEFYFDSDDQNSIADAVAMAKLNVYGEDASIKTDVAPFGEQFIIRVTVSYTVVYGGK